MKDPFFKKHAYPPFTPLTPHYTPTPFRQNKERELGAGLRAVAPGQRAWQIAG